MRKFKHKKTGKLYELVQDHLLIKERRNVADESGISRFEFNWNKREAPNLVLYKALYDNTDGPYFVRCNDDFYNSFEEVEESDIEDGEKMACYNCLRNSVGHCPIKGEIYENDPACEQYI